MVNMGKWEGVQRIGLGQEKESFSESRRKEKGKWREKKELKRATLDGLKFNKKMIASPTESKEVRRPGDLEHHLREKSQGINKD